MTANFAVTAKSATTRSGSRHPGSCVFVNQSYHDYHPYLMGLVCDICTPGNVCSADGIKVLIYEHPGGSSEGDVSGVCLCVSYHGTYQDRETRNTRSVVTCEGVYVALQAQRHPQDWHEREMPKMLNVLREMWPELPDTILQEAPLGYEDG